MAGSVFYTTVVIRNNSEQPAFNIVARVSTPKEKGAINFTRAKNQRQAARNRKRSRDDCRGETAVLPLGLKSILKRKTGTTTYSSPWNTGTLSGRISLFRSGKH